MNTRSSPASGRPSSPTNDADMKIATDWYTWGFQSGMDAARSSADSADLIKMLDVHVDGVRHYLHLQIGKPLSKDLISAPEIALDNLHREMKAALRSSDPAQTKPDRLAVARLVCCGHKGCLLMGDSEDGEKCYCDTSDFVGSGMEKTVDAVLALSSTDRADCAHRIEVTPRNGAPHGAGFACGLSGGHCQPKDGCGYVAISSPLRQTGET